MALKRKRSSQSLSPSSPSSTTTSTSHPELTVTHFYPPTKPHSPAFHDIKSHLSSRTLKRHRDNRPSESIVHASTLHKLFAAQRRPHDSPPSTPIREGDVDVDMGDGEAEAEAQEVQLPRQTCTLYAFWGRHGPQQQGMEVDMMRSDPGVGMGRGLS